MSSPQAAIAHLQQQHLMRLLMKVMVLKYLGKRTLFARQVLRTSSLMPRRVLLHPIL
jgi:hypothetical protein